MEVKDYFPINIFNTKNKKLNLKKYQKIDAHSHFFFDDEYQINEWIKYIKKYNIVQTHIMSCSWYNKSLTEVLERCKEFPGLFSIWASFDYTDIDKPNFSELSIETLKKYKKLGIIGIGEFIDKGNGDETAVPISGNKIHINDPRLFNTLEECGRLKFPIAVHIGEPIWMYLNSENNDGLNNSEKWKINENSVELGFEELQKGFEEVLKQHPNTIFIGCHFLNLVHDLPRLSKLLDQYPNLFVDCSARMPEVSQTIYTTKEFFKKYQNRIIFGNDMRAHKLIWPNTIRILETKDEHFYQPKCGYHWSYTGLNIKPEILEKVYKENIKNILQNYDKCIQDNLLEISK